MSDGYEFITGPLLTDPRRIGKRLLLPMDDRFSARRGTYWVIYRIDDKASVVTAWRQRRPLHWESAPHRRRTGAGLSARHATPSLVPRPLQSHALARYGASVRAKSGAVAEISEALGQESDLVEGHAASVASR